MASEDYEQKKAKCKPRNPCILIRKLVDLMEHPISEHATVRHLQLLNEFLNASHYAFWLRDITYIIRLYENIVRRLETISAYKRPLECLLYFSAIPPMLTKVSEALEYARDFQEYFSVLGYLILCLHDDDLKKLVLNAIKNLLEPKPPVGYCCVSVECTREAAEKSQLPAIFAQLLQVANDNLYPLLLDVMYLICQISTTVCQKILEENALEYLLQRFEPTWRERNIETRPKNPSSSDTIPHFEDTCTILWKLLRTVDRDKVNVKDPSVFALWSLQYAFRWSNICPGQRVNRNNMSALILKFMTTFPTMGFMESDLADDIAIMAMVAAGCTCRSNVQLLDDNLDFQFKKIIWVCLHFYGQSQIAELIKENEIVKAFTKCLFQEHTTRRDHIERYCQLAKIILKIMPKFLEWSMDMFFSVNGPIKILHIIEGYLIKTYDLQLLEAYIYCLSEMALLNVEDVTIILGENDTVDILIMICQKLLNSPTLSTTHQKILARSFCVLQILCNAGYMSNNEVINICISYLDRVIHPNENDPLIDVRVTACTVHLLWECILATQQLYSTFLKKGGVYVMLDITEKFTFPVKSLSLGVLADVTRKSSCIPYLITWRKCGKKLLPMLMEIFRCKTEKQCDTALKVEMSEEKHNNFWVALCHGQQITFHKTCTSKAELLESCRCRIHAILQALKVKFKERVELANEHYKLYNEKLNTDDDLTMLFAENYLSLRMCEGWLRVSKELQKEGITPVETDNDLLMERVKQIRQWKTYIQYRIELIVKNEKQTEHFHELETYTTLKEARLSDALDGLKDLSYISNCTERMFQMRKKLILSQEVDAVRVKNANFHRTICDLPFTNIYNQRISIQSNIIYEKNEEKIPFSPVSLEYDDLLHSIPSQDDLSEYQLEC